jgi:hypothetical protein
MRHGFFTVSTRVRGVRTPASSRAINSILVAPMAVRMAIGPTSVGISASSPAWTCASNSLRPGGRGSSRGIAPASVKKCSSTVAPIPVSLAAVRRECNRRSGSGLAQHHLARGKRPVVKNAVPQNLAKRVKALILQVIPVQPDIKRPEGLLPGSSSAPVALAAIWSGPPLSPPHRPPQHRTPPHGYCRKRCHPPAHPAATKPAPASGTGWSRQNWVILQPGVIRPILQPPIKPEVIGRWHPCRLVQRP